MKAVGAPIKAQAQVNIANAPKDPPNDWTGSQSAAAHRRAEPVFGRTTASSLDQDQ